MADRWQEDGWERLLGRTSIADLPEALAQIEREAWAQAEVWRWELEVRGTPRGALATWEADRWWKGSFRIPLGRALGY